jgi:hypothetical protein
MVPQCKEVCLCVKPTIWDWMEGVLLVLPRAFVGIVLQALVEAVLILTTLSSAPVNNWRGPSNRRSNYLTLVAIVVVQDRCMLRKLIPLISVISFRRLMLNLHIWSLVKLCFGIIVCLEVWPNWLTLLLM